MHIIYLVFFAVFYCQEQVQVEGQTLKPPQKPQERMLGQPRQLDLDVCQERLNQAFKNYNLQFAEDQQFLVQKCETNNWGRLNFNMDLIINNKRCRATVYQQKDNYLLDLEPLYQNACFVPIMTSDQN